MGETAQPLPLLRPIVTPTMGGLMDLRAPTSAICTLRWANVVSLLDWFLMIPVDQDQAYSACFPGGGGGFPDWSCDPARFLSQPQIFSKNFANAILSWKTQLNLDQPYHPRIVTLIDQANPNCYLDCYDSYCCQVFNYFYLLAEDIISIAKLKLSGPLCLWWGDLLYQLQLVRKLRLSYTHNIGWMVSL